MGVYLPVSVIYRLFGVSATTTTVWPLLSALLIIVMVWVALLMQPLSAKVYGIVLSVTCIALFRQSCDLYPDIIAAAFIALSSLALYFRRWASAERGRWVVPIGAVAALLVAFAAKETAYWVLPVWAMTLVWDLKQGHHIILRRFYLPAICSIILLGALYLLLMQLEFGDCLARFKGVQELSGKHLWSWHDRNIFFRITVAPVIFLLREYGIILIMVFLDFVVYPGKMRFWKLYTVTLLLLFWFGTSSFTQYEPLPLEERMSLPLLPGFVILASHFGSRLFALGEERAAFRPWPVFFLIAFLVAYPCARFHVGAQKWQFREISGAMTIVKEKMQTNAGFRYLLLTSDKRSPEILPFFFSYNYPSNLVVCSFEKGRILVETGDYDYLFLYVDGPLSSMWKVAYGIANYDEAFRALGLEMIYECNEVRLFTGQIDGLLRKSLMGIPIAKRDVK